MEKIAPTCAESPLHIFNAIASMNADDIADLQGSLDYKVRHFARNGDYHSAACVNALVSLLFQCEMKSRQLARQEEMKEEELRKRNRARLDEALANQEKWARDKARHDEIEVEEEDDEPLLVLDEEKCPLCLGAGKNELNESCHRCEGTGYL